MSSNTLNLIGGIGIVVLGGYAALKLHEVIEILSSAPTAIEVAQEGMTPAQAYAEEKGLSYTFGGHDTTHDPILMAFMQGKPSFANMQLVETEARVTLEGRETTEVYTTEIIARSDRFLSDTKDLVYANECTVSGEDVAGRILYRDLTKPLAGYREAQSNDIQHMAVASQMNCALMLENGTFDSFKEQALADLDQ